MLPAGSRWTHIPRPSLLRSDGLRAVSFTFCRQPPQRLGEAGLLGAVPSLCLLEMARSVLKHWLFIEVRSG